MKGINKERNRIKREYKDVADICTMFLGCGKALRKLGIVPNKKESRSLRSREIQNIPRKIIPKSEIKSLAVELVVRGGDSVSIALLGHVYPFCISKAILVAEDIARDFTLFGISVHN